MTAAATAPSGLTVAVALASAAARLAAAGVDAPRLDARLLLAAALSQSTETLVAWPEREVAADGAARFEELLGRREAREPLAQILGQREFWSLPFRVTRDTLTPRPDSETLIEMALDLMPDRTAPLSILDLGTGTGCLLLALLSEYTRATGVGTDISQAALDVARANAIALGLRNRARFVCTDWSHGIAERFDLIVCNPPYVETDRFLELQPEIRVYEPQHALVGGRDGLAPYRKVALDLCARLAPAGTAIFEIGAGQAQAVEQIMRGAGLDIVGRRHDLGGVLRCLAVRG